MRALPWLLVLPALACATDAAAARAAQTIPTVYAAGHFYATPRTRSGQSLRLLVDTGGGGGQYGLYWITLKAAQRLHLRTRACLIDGNRLTVAPLPRYDAGMGLPAPQATPCGQVLLVQQARSNDDGQFSGSYLYQGGVWTFDYPARRLIRQGDDWKPAAAAHPAPLRFKKNSHGEVIFGYARIVIRVDGQPLDMLLDTGATAYPTAAGEQASHTPTVGGFGVTSYVTTRVFDRWHRAHPAWRVVQAGDDLFGPRSPMRLIEVPRVEIAGWSVGPVWFTERPNAAFDDMMSPLMDRQIDGAVGGNVFRHFVLSIDYPRETAYFRCARGCTATATPLPVP